MNPCDTCGTPTDHQTHGNVWTFCESCDRHGIAPWQWRGTLEATLAVLRTLPPPVQGQWAVYPPR